MAPGEPKVSAVLIVKDSAAHLRECLASVAWCDEIVVLDGGSTDATVAICAEFKARVDVERDWQGFGVQKNRALSRARSEWVFSIDADEVCPPELRAELQLAAASGRHAAYEMPRRSRLFSSVSIRWATSASTIACGKWIWERFTISATMSRSR